MSELEPHLLVVDDDARLRDLLRRYLSENGFRVTVAADATEARANLASFTFDLRELLLRIRNIIERRGVADDAARAIRFGRFRFDLARGELFRAGEIVH